MFCRIILSVFLLATTHCAMAQQLYELSKGSVKFYSDAPLELIKATSDELQGLLDLQQKQFAFRVPISSFMGFNSPLQKEHFNENYMETIAHPVATFSGKIIEDINLQKDGEYKIRAKGKLNIHGVEQERIIYVKVKVKQGQIFAVSDFMVALSDHNIKIPRVVYDKLAPDINVSVTSLLIPKSN